MNEGYRIRQANIHDLDEIAKLEQLCFSEKEAASKATFFERLEVYPNHFWLLEKEAQIISMINGIVTNHKNLNDEMYHNPKLHNEKGQWQMIFGVETHPLYQKMGYATLLLKRVIEETKRQNRAGLVLTCKEQLILFYEKVGFKNEGISKSEHGNLTWYQMRMEF